MKTEIVGWPQGHEIVFNQRNRCFQGTPFAEP